MGSGRSSIFDSRFRRGDRLESDSGNECGLPRRWELEWKNEAIQIHPHNADARHRFVDRRIEAFWDQPQPKGGWWENLFVGQQAAECVAALLIHPIMEEWVTRNPVVTSS